MGRVALVTGASGGGIGRSVALALARQGADLIITYRRHREEAQRVAHLIAGMGRRALLRPADVGREEDVRGVVEEGLATFGHIDILVNSAGGPWQPRDIVDIPPDHWRRVLAAEVDGAFYAIKYVLPGMRRRGWGRIINIGGYLADHWPLGPPEAPLDYPLGKAGRHWLVRTLAPRELKHGITINAIAPGTIPHISLEEALALLEEGEPWRGRRAPTPQDVAAAVLFLVSEAARFVTGTVLFIPGAP